MIGPFVILNPAIEGSVIVESTAYVEDQVIIGVAFVEIGHNIFNGIAIGLFQ